MNKSITLYDDYVLYLHSKMQFPAGGAATQTLNWYKSLKKVGVEVKLYGAHPNPSYFANDEDIIIAYNPTFGIRKLRYFYYKLPKLILNTLKLKSTHIYFSVPGVLIGFLIFLLSKTSKKTIIRVSSDVQVEAQYTKDFNRFQKTMWQFCFKHSDYIFVQNTYQLNRFQKLYPNKVYKLRNPYGGSINEKPLPYESRSYIAWIGNIREAKNIPLLIEIAKKLPKVEFVIAGKVLNKASKLLEEFNLLVELENVRYLGFLNTAQIAEVLAQSYFLLNTSHFEGFSNTYLEAFAAGTPVLSPKQNDPDDIIQNNKMGYIYNDAEGLQKFIKNLEEDVMLYQILVENCKNYMLNQHSPEKQGNEFRNIIEDY